MNGSIRLYRSLLRVYPRRFRDEYGTDMALLFADQLRDEPAARVWARSVVDLAITVPTRHLEHHMERPPNSTVPIIYSATAATGLVFAALTGMNAVALLGLAVAVVAGTLAVVSWRTNRQVTATHPASSRWWQILLVGVGLLTSMIVALNIVGEVPDDWWEPMMASLLVGILLTAGGLILGIAHLASNRHHTATS